MKLFYLLGYIAVIIWAIVPISQYNGKYFFYFLFLVSSDIITLIARLVFHSGTNFFYGPLTLLSLYALLKVKQIKKHKILLAILFIITCIFNLDINIIGIPEFQLMGLSLGIIHLVILYIFIKELFIKYENNYVINLFLVALVFYELTAVTKFLNYLTGFTNDYFYYIITNIFEILFALFFIVFKADDKRLILQFK